MRTTRFLLALLIAAFLNACGGNDHDDNQASRIQFSQQVTFGDSLSDVGSYAVGAIRALGGGKFTINGDNTAQNPALTGKNWTELTAAQFGLPAPCPAQTGLEGDPTSGFSVPVENHPNCFGYAQGGARVTNPVGTGNARTGSPVGALTLPVVAQVANHLRAAGGRFRGDEIVFVTAGGNDLLSLLEEVAAGAISAPEAVAAMERAADELVALVTTQIVGKGANYVVVNNVPDLTSAPEGRTAPAPIQDLVKLMVAVFNQRLQAGLGGEGKVLYVDLYALTRDQVANPAPYGLTNTANVACGPNALGGRSLVCNASNTLPGVDVSHYMFADSVHPTPFEYSLIARQVAQRMMTKGWL